MTTTPTQLGFEGQPQRAPVRRRMSSADIHEQYVPEQWTYPVIVVQPPVPTLMHTNAQSRGWLQRTASVINGALRGNIGSALQVTLAARATSSTFSDLRISTRSHLIFTPQTASAATAWNSGQMYVVPGIGQATIMHPSVNATDQTFSVAIVR
jgi:hypothetical protein